MLLIHIKVYEICNNGNINDHYFNVCDGSNGTQLTQTMGLQENTPETTTGNMTELIAPG
jgi:hypothetical protein